MTNQGFLLILSLPVLMSGLAVLLREKGIERRIHAAKMRWQTAQGVVIESQLSEEQAARATVYSSDIRYRYEVSGTTYEGNQVTLFDTKTGWPAPQVELVSRYPVKKQVLVYYNPQEPQSSALELRRSDGAKVFPFIAWFLLAFGGLLSGLVMLIPH